MDQIDRTMPYQFRSGRARTQRLRGAIRVAKPSSVLPRVLRAPADRLIAALADPARRERIVVAVLLAYVAIWTLYGVLAKSAQDLHPDMSELVAWSRDPQLGYWKHPPLAAYVVGLWFLVFPVADWSYHLLGAANAALTLWIVWRLSADYLGGEKRAVALALLTLVPFYNFHALKYNVNAVLLPLWAATTLFHLRAFCSQRSRDAALAGLFAAASMLGKHWSAFFLAGLALATLVHPGRAAYFRSRAPWITIAVGLTVLAPHLVWLWQHAFSPLSYATQLHTGRSFVSGLIASGGFLLGSAGYVALPVALALAAARPNGAQLRDMVLPKDPHRRLAALAFLLPLLVPAAAAPFMGLELTSLWSMPAFTLLPVLLLSPAGLSLSADGRRAIVLFAATLAFVMLLAAPAVSVVVHRGGVMPAMAHAHLLARAVEAEWRRVSREPIRLVGGEATLAFGTAFYLSDRPSAFPELDRAAAPWVDEARIARQGIVLLCPAHDAGCRAQIDAFTQSRQVARRIEIALTRRHYGVADASGRYSIVIVPPTR